MALSISPTEILEKDEHPLLRKAPSWGRVFLRQIAGVQNGFPFKSSLFSAERGFPLIRIRDVGRDGTKYFYTGDYEKEFVVSRGDILIGMDGDFRAARWHGPDALLNQRVCRLFLTSEDYDEDFLFLCLQPYLNAVHSETSSVTVKHLSSKTIQDLPLPLPPLNEQRRIVEKIEAMFERIDKGVENLRAAKATLALYRQSLLKSAFEGRLTADWRAQNADKLEDPKTLLARIQKERDTRYKAALDAWQDALTAWRADGEKGKRPAKPRRDAEPDAPMSEQRALMNGIPTEWQWLQIGTFGFVTKLAGFEYTKHVIYREDGDLPVIKAENAGKNGFKVTDYSRVRSEEVAMLTRSFLNGGELLMVFVGAGTGQVATVPTDQRYFLGPNIGMIRLETHDILPKFIEHYLRSPIGTSMKLASVKAVAQPSLSMGTIRQIPVTIPSPAEQVEIVRILDARLDAADKMEAEIDATLTRADALRQSILIQAFSGKLVPQDPTDEPATTLLARIKADRAKVPKPARTRKTPA